ncbi:arylsulfatase [Nocardioides guangzhouensis]|uniref:Arylsulfatase n=1 Tax=Nocardioides guangzhouensis TaxID=2497878 RepID=A0A4Q4Z2Q4_9ACTN|nr:arylsulfatase [Nocardioides guangzhouensis]RYP81485.1 arylsulfatase [Nocardioides guangzhouensis]
MTVPSDRPDVVLVLADDMGFSDVGCYGGEIATPNIDRLAREGVRFTQFYNTARCSPSRASLLTGLHPHQVGVGILNFDDSPDGYPGDLSPESVTIAEALGAAGYATYLSGKWHLSSQMDRPSPSWPTRRGFDRFFGTLEGAGSFYQPRTLTRDEENVEEEGERPDFFYTDAISDAAVDFVAGHHRDRPHDPLFLYLAYTAPHWPLHAHEEDIAKYDGVYDAGWYLLREERLARLVQEGVLEPGTAMAERDPRVPGWEGRTGKDWEARRMQTYAAQVDRMDQGIGRVLTALEETGRLDNTIVVFLSDNGGCAEEMPPESVEEFVTAFVPIKGETREGDRVVPGNVPGLDPGPEATYQSYGRSWAHLSNTPFREYKHWVHEGGIATPLVVRWPDGLRDAPELVRTPYQLVDVLPTLLDATGAAWPPERDGHRVPPAEGVSMLPALRGQETQPRELFWEHEGNAAIRSGRWKLVRKHDGDWELYDIERDRAEQHDLSGRHPDVVADLAARYDAWAARCGVIPRQQVLDLYAARGHGLPPE